MFDVKTEEGVVTGRVNGVHMDAAVVGDTAGIEVSLDHMHAFDGHRGTRAAQLVLSLDLDPATMRDLAVLLAVKSGMPAFNEREWLEIADMLERGTRRSPETNAASDRYAAQIREAYS